MAELSQIFGFLIIFKDSFKLISKNVNFIAPITLLSLLLPSIILLLFTYIYQTLTNSILKTLDSNSSSYLPIITYSSLLFVFEIISIIIFVVISHISGIATILVSATSSTDTKISPQHLYSRLKTATEKKVLTLGSRTPSKRSPRGLFVLVLATIVWTFLDVLAIIYRNPITIFVAAVLGVSFFAFHLYASVPRVLSHVVSIVEEKYEGSEALEIAEEIVQGHRHHGFMINLFFNLLFLTFTPGFWILRQRLGFVNVWGFLLVLVNCFSLAKIYVCVAYTVLYFRCKMYHGEEIGVVANFDYSKLGGGADTA